MAQEIDPMPTSSQNNDIMKSIENKYLFFYSKKINK